ncbi:MAG: hypothetical protein ACRDT0_07380 [Pseudonocardiaceae bacterium]
MPNIKTGHDLAGLEEYSPKPGYSPEAVVPAGVLPATSRWLREGSVTPPSAPKLVTLPVPDPIPPARTCRNGLWTRRKLSRAAAAVVILILVSVVFSVGSVSPTAGNISGDAPAQLSGTDPQTSMSIEVRNPAPPQPLVLSPPVVDNSKTTMATPPIDNPKAKTSLPPARSLDPATSTATTPSAGGGQVDKPPAQIGPAASPATGGQVAMLPPHDPAPAATDGVRCDPFSNPAVVMESIAATDGGPGIATFNTIRLNVLRAAPSEYTYWIIAHLFRTDGSPYIAKAQVRSSTGFESHDLQFKDVVGSVRDIYIVEADPAGTEQLRQNNATQLDGSQDATRQQPPPGQVVSMTCHVTKTRQQ